MATRHKIMHYKNGATFANGQEALANLQSQYPADKKLAIENWHTSMLNSGILLKPVEVNWDQDNYTLTVVREVSDYDAYINSRPYSRDDSVASGTASGWTNVGAFSEDI